jgi:hypothetical protein
MLITEWRTGAPAFATAEDPAWRLAPSHDGVEDAIHHDGQFYSVSYNGLVEAWERDAESGAYTGTAVAPRLAVEEHRRDGLEPSCRKYLAIQISAQCGRNKKHARKRIDRVSPPVLMLVPSCRVHMLIN